MDTIPAAESRVTVYDDNSTETKEFVYLYDESGIIGATFSNNGATANSYYYRRNLQGDVIAIYDASGSRKVEYAYDAYGNCSIVYGSSHDLARRNPIRYRGYYYDRETNLYYLNARYYNPEWRRFISPDDTAYIAPDTPNGLNLYCYCNNDPVNYVDPSGHVPVDTIIDIGFALWSLIDLIRNPSWENAGWFALDLACFIIPYATGGSTAVKVIVKGVNGADNLLDASKVPGYIMRNADDVVILGQNMDRVYDASRKIGGGILYSMDNYNDIVRTLGADAANQLAYADNMKWVAKQAWAGKTVLNVGWDVNRLANPSLHVQSFKVCRGELFFYRLAMFGKFMAFWTHRIYRLFGG